MSTRWFKNAIIYSLDVETFQDSNGDGIGDLRGLCDRLDYIESLGITCLWLLPFYPTPNRDNGYDVTDYINVDARLGNLADFVDVVQQAGERGLRVIIDLVLNHTSIEHPWFQAARRGDPRFRDFYVWRKDQPPDTSKHAAFPPKQKSIWTYDDEAQAWYMHRFYEWQPDLNISNPAVRQEIERIMAFWLQLGVSGFRVDAAPYLVEMHGTTDSPESMEYHYGYLREFREYLTWQRGDAVLLAEANVAPEHLAKYFGDGDRMHMLFNFLANQQTFLSFARHSARPLRDSMQHLPEKPEGAQWAYFLRNHDELSLDKLTKEQREECFTAFGPEEQMRLFDRGIRRRLAPMLRQDSARLRLAYSLLFSMPGAPVIWYGEEIGMGDDLDQQERNSVRSPMQWSNEANAGFSNAPMDKLLRPVISYGDFGFQRVNVESQQRDLDSLLSFLSRMANTRKRCPEFAMGTWQVLQTSADDTVFALLCEWKGDRVATVHNFSSAGVTVRIQLPGDAPSGTALDLHSSRDYLVDGGVCEIELEPCGYRWLRLRS